ncbi:MAG: ATP-binding protein [Acidobacteriota bacterium]
MNKAAVQNFLGYTSAVLSVAAVTAFYRLVIVDVNHTTVALSFLLVVLLVASFHKLKSAIFTAITAIFCFNFFFLPPFGTLTIEDPQNWVALFAFLITAIIASQLSAIARQRAREAERRREELFKLYQLSQSIIITPDSKAVMPSLVRQIVTEFDVSFCTLFIKSEDGDWHQLNVATRSEYGRFIEPNASILDESFASGEIIEADLPEKRRQDLQSQHIYYAPLKIGVKSIGVMVVTVSTLERGTIEAIAGLVALAMERTAMLKELSYTEALKQSDELKSALLASVSHDLRTPLTSMRAAIDNLLQKDVEWDKEALSEFHLIISEDVQRLTRLVQNLLEMARIEAGELHLAKEWAAVAEIISNTVERCADATRNHKIVVDADEFLPFVKVDSLLLTQALSYVVENAAKYSPTDRVITIRARVGKDRLSLSVEDKGEGISAEEIAHIFDRFYRSASKSVQQRSGTGMGLSIARGIIEAHGGRISVESELGRGSTFTFEIPTATKSVAAMRIEQENNEAVYE